MTGRNKLTPDEDSARSVSLSSLPLTLPHHVSYLFKTRCLYYLIPLQVFSLSTKVPSRLHVYRTPCIVVCCANRALGIELHRTVVEIQHRSRP